MAKGGMEKTPVKNEEELASFLPSRWLSYNI